MAQDEETQGQELNTLKQQFAAMQSLLSIPEVRAVLDSLREAQTKAGAENESPPAIDRKEQEKGKAPLLLEKDKSPTEKEKEATNEAESNPSLSLLKGLEITNSLPSTCPLILLVRRFLSMTSQRKSPRRSITRAIMRRSIRRQGL